MHTRKARVRKASTNTAATTRQRTAVSGEGACSKSGPLLWLEDEAGGAESTIDV